MSLILKSMLCAAASVAVMLVLIALVPTEVLLFLGFVGCVFGVMTCVFLEIFGRRDRQKRLSETQEEKEQMEPETQCVFLCPQDASVLLEKLFSILKGLSVDEAPWSKDCFALSGALAVGKAVGVVQVYLNVAKVLQGVLNNHLVAHPYEKDQFFAELCRLEDAIAKAESKERA